jgi:anti-sigma regulatory factor (Ser/Thr protein kinase)
MFSQSSYIADSESAVLTLLVSELVSNAVLHSDAPADSDIILQLHEHSPGVVRVDVRDAGSGFVNVPRNPHRIGGYGLLLVDAEARRWGVEREGGTHVWFELASPAASAVAP